MPIEELFAQYLPPELKHKLPSILNSSLYLQRQLERSPDYCKALSESEAYAENALSEKITAEIINIDNESDLLRAVRQIRHRETVRIAWRDLADLASLDEVMRDVSDLADALVSNALDWWNIRLCEKFGTPHDRTGTPQHMLVLGLGKLGGRELNFSSDIDLIFTFPESGNTDGRRALDNQTYFTRLGQKLINTLGQVTGDGFAYRVDMRLRPFGEVGALALSFDAMEHYYQAHGREWERYALIKARVMAGDQQEGSELMQRLRPFIYRRYLDYGAVEQLRDMKNMINREARRKGKHHNVKLGTGGIREIEFTAQVFQLMRGGRLKDLQQQSLLPTLKVLEEHELLTPVETEQLRSAYIFLRRTENRLQMWNDEQTHSLPENELQHAQLARSMDEHNLEHFTATLDQHRRNVSSIFQRIFAVEEDEKQEHQALQQLWLENIEHQAALELLEQWGFQPANIAFQQLSDLRESRRYQSLTDLARARLDRLIPLLIGICAPQENPNLALSRSLQVIQAIASRSGYIAMLFDQPSAAKQFVKLIHASIWITTQLTQHPILLDGLLDTRQLYLPLNRDELDATLKQELANIDTNDTGLVMERLRQFKLAQTLRVAAADITGMLPLMVVSDQLSWIAEAILEQTVQHVWQVMTSKSGVPCYTNDDQQHTADFGIVAYGKLGGLELGYSSDLDIIFIHDSTGTQQRTNGDKQMDNPVFFARLAQKVIHILSTYTHEGRLYEIDTRLRPSGKSGLLVTAIHSLQQYQMEKAWVWEHQALLRSRIITGSKVLRERYEAMRRFILCQPRNADVLRAEVVSMRKKMWTTLSSKENDLFNLKKDHGGITDIEFMVQYLILANAHNHPELVKWSDNIRQLESLKQHGILGEERADKLAEIYRTLRNRVHELALQEEKAFVYANESKEQRSYVQQCWVELMGNI